MMMEAEIDSKAFQEIVDDFVEVHKAASQEVDVGVVLSDVKITLQAGEKKYKEFIGAFTVTCEHARAKLQSHIKRLETSTTEAKHQVANLWGKQLEKGREGIKEAQTQSKKTQENLEKVRKDMTDIVIKYHRGVVEADAKLMVVKQLRDIIEDELINPTGKSFIQISKFNAKLQDLQALIQKSGDGFYTPIIQTLVQLASEQNFADQKILQAILKNLNALEASLKKFKEEREVSLKVTLKNLKAQEENLVAQLQDYHHLEQKSMSDVQEANQNIKLINDLLVTLASEIARKQDELRNINHLCDTENKMFKDGLHRIDLVRKDVSLAVDHMMQLNR